MLPYKTPKQATEEAREKVIAERSGEQYGLKTTFNELNIGMGKYFRFANVNLYGGLSGHGKSYLINKLNKDFQDPVLNKDINFIPIILHFGFEMSASDEVLRNVASDLEVSYQHLLSSQYNKEDKNYNVITDSEFSRIEECFKAYENRNILYFETPSNIKLMYATVVSLSKHYNALALNKAKQNNTKIKPYKFIVNVDHTLLVDVLDEKSTLDLMANVGKYAILMRKELGCMVNLIGQLNNNIEDVRRLTTPTLHYPQKSDIYAQGQLFNACDNVFIIHQPQLLKISYYGKYKYPTAKLVHLIKIKSRHGNVGSIWFLNMLHKGKLICIDINEHIKKLKENNNNEELPQHL